MTPAIYGQTKFDGSKISKAASKVVKDIEEINVVMGNAVGFAGKRPKQYDNFVKLKTKATTEELKELTNHPNPTVRSYAFWALSYDHSIDLLPIVLDHINDTALVATQFGCIGIEESVGDFFISVVTPRLIDLDSKKLDSVEFAILDSVLIYTPSDLWARTAAIVRAEPTEGLYPRIRELVMKENNQAALVPLAKYQKEQDVELILKNLEEGELDEGSLFYSYKAITHFPHPAFLPLLEKNLQQALVDNTYFGRKWRGLYKAIASYKNDKAVELLQLSLTQAKYSDIEEYHIDLVFNALREFKDPIYEDLLWKLWTEENRMTPDVFQYLSSINPDKTFELAKESLKNANEFYNANVKLNLGNVDAPENLISAMLKLVVKQDREYGLAIIRKNIQEVDVLLFPIFADKAAEIKDQSFVEPLFDRLETESNPHIYLKAIEALIAYQDTEINQRILKARKKSKHLNKGWGAKALDKLLQDHNIQ